MRSVTYSMGMTLDGYIIGPDGTFDWSEPSEEVFRLSIDEIKSVGVHLMGRRLYETMLYWETPEQQATFDDTEREWAAHEQRRVGLELLETRTFDNGVVFLRYRARP